MAEAGLAGKIAQVKADHVFFLQGAPADSIFYLQKARARLTVVSKSGKKATITLLGAGDFIGEESLAAAGGFAWQRPPPLPRAPHSGSSAQR